MLAGLLLARFVAHGQQLISPDHNLALTFSLTSQGAPMYALAYKGKLFLGQSQNTDNRAL
jgi:glucan 1,4-alpha-glucosidase